MDALLGWIGASAFGPRPSPRFSSHQLGQCRGCSEICDLLRWAEVQRRRDSAYQGSSSPRTIHSSYLELDECAGRLGCHTCRVIRRALLLDQITVLDAERLGHTNNQWPIQAALDLCSSGDSRLLLTIKSEKRVLFSASIQLTNEPRPLAQRRTKRAMGLRSDLSELRRVIDDCHRNHECSSRYRWSRRNPTWLLKILPENRVQLVEGPQTPVDYVVLSYSWGDPTTMPAEEWARIKGAGTRTINGRPVPERLNPFWVWDLPETMQDAIAVSASLGFFYIWIDNVCIPKGTDWDKEAGLMHEVYGNAAFTLIASSSVKATDRLLHDRSAWTHRVKESQLREQWWLHNTQMSLDRVRLEAPVSRRAWTLQEERLSPRIVYWAGQRWYWSCPECQTLELDISEYNRNATTTTSQTYSQQFLQVCHTGDERQLHEEWLDIVEAYTPRDLVAPKDRFLAIAGLAVRFYNAKAANGGTAITEEYLAGLWKDDFARHLSWSVTTAVDPSQNLRDIAPSFSWASLPLQTHTRTKSPFSPTQHFRFISVEHVEPAVGVPTTPENEQRVRRASIDYINRGRAIEERGRRVKVVEVEGRFRSFISADAQEVPWGAIECNRGGRPGFDFGSFPGRDIFARNWEDGRILAKDAHSGEVVGQLDYLAPLGEKPKNRFTPYVQLTGEKEIVCLELGELAMLLLVPNRKWGQPESYRRVGVAVGYSSRKGFFYGCETKRVRLG